MPKSFKNKLTAALVLLLPLLMLAGCGRKYEDTRSIFNDAGSIEAGEFKLDIKADITKDGVKASTSVSASGLKDGDAAVFKMDYSAVSGDIKESGKYPQVLLTEAGDVHDNILYFLYEAADNSIKIDGRNFSAGTADASAAADMTEFLSDLSLSCGSEDLSALLKTVTGDLRQEDSEAAVNVKGSIEKKSFSENVDVSVRFAGYEIDLNLDYSIKGKDVSYSAKEDYVSLRTASLKYYMALEDMLAQSGVYVPEGREIKSHVVDSSSLIIEGIDEEFYKVTWDPDAFEFAGEGSNLELGQWALSGKGNSASVVFSMFDMDTEGLIEHYKETYGDNMSVSYTSEEVEGAAGSMTHIVLTLGMEGGDSYVDNMFVYQVNEEFLVQCMVTSDGSMTDEELIDLAFHSMEVYKAV